MTAQKQEFLGGLIGGILVKKGVEFAIDKAIDKVAKSPSLSLEKKDASAVKEIVKVEVEKEVQARVEHQTDTEPHYSSRNIWGSIVGIVAFIEAFRLAWGDNVEQTPTQWLAIFGILITALTPLYSRFIARKPLGR
jgi:hypothetical protein